VASSIFEDLGFLLVHREPAGEQGAGALDGAVSVAFEGALRGRVEVRLFGGVLPLLTANLLGDDGVPSPALQRDALGEVANVICGNVLPLLAGSRAEFRLSEPLPAAPEAAAEPAACAVVGVEQGRAEVRLIAEELFRGE
jgi:hypothetical protein